LRLPATLLTLAVVLLVSGHTQAASAKQESSTEVKLRHSTNVLNFFETHQWLPAPRKDKCWEVPWRKSCRIARDLIEHHSLRVVKLKRELERTIPNTDNWTRAMRYAQKPYPGTYERLEFLSGRECRACYTVPGGFICNYQGSGACGPMQFMESTFYGHADDAKADMKRRGFIVADEVWNWHNPLGQALVAAYMHYYNKDGCHWCL
jgi:hypothetical protein